MDSHELRERFLAFFKRHEHAVVPSDSLIPSGDPTVLFTSAGMNQFKDYFLGKRTDLTRAVSCQKCLRTGDLDKVGKSPSHHSFFEMLGNFSFGDYFKREAIQWAWEFLTVCLSLPGTKLWVSIYEEDEEAFKLWRELGVPAERIRRFGQAENFWPANAPKEGPNGPCGPCSEIYFDPDGAVQGTKSVEIWNLVFTQFDRQPDGSLKPLPKPNIDTGMGLERLTRVIQGVETDYETDLFTPIMDAIRELPQGRKVKKDRITIAERAIADHARAIIFLLAEGVMPSNESRGYVLRMLIRRVYRFACVDLDIEPHIAPDFLCTLQTPVIQAMRGSPYSNWLESKEDVMQRIWNQELLQFSMTLEEGTARFEELMRELIRSGKYDHISGEDAFKLHDTYGVPLEFILDLAEERGITVDQAGFKAEMQRQQERSRAASQFGDAVFVPTTLTLKDVPKSEFVGYDTLQADTVVKGLWKQDGWVQSAREGDEVGVVLERSPFYGESGGQVGDQGTIDAPRGRLDVLETRWADELLVHHAKVRQGTVSVNDPVRATVDAARRLKIARSHTATHLLHWALRKVLGPETVQAGSLVEAERVRFDFSALGGLKDEQRMKVEQLVNNRVLAEDRVQTDLMNVEDAKRAGALALFGEKYHSQVRVVSIGDYSKELCGGTHLAHTGSVGAFQIVAESSIAAGTRRLEAVVGESALARQQQDAQVLRVIAEQLGRSPQDVLQGIEDMAEQVKAAERQLKNLKTEFARLQAKQFVAEAKRINGIALVTARVDGADRELLAAMADAIRGALTDGVALLVSVEQPSTVAWVMALTATLVKRGLHAGRLLKPIAAITQGGGGGRPEFAQAGGKDPSRIPEALMQAEQLLREALTR